jgi:hypothetical protein
MLEMVISSHKLTSLELKLLSWLSYVELVSLGACFLTMLNHMYLLACICFLIYGSAKLMREALTFRLIFTLCWKLKSQIYTTSKQVCHSSNYGIRPNTFALNTLEKSKGRIVLSKDQCEKYLSFYHSLFPEIQDWHREVQRQLEATRTLYNLFGYPRYFSGELNESSIKEAFAFVPQSTVGCITAKAYTKLQQFIEEQHLQWNLLADTHDSYLVEAPDDEVLDCVKIMKSFMEQDLISPRQEAFKMKAECSIGYNWAPFNEKYNIDGLKEIKL